MPGESQGERPHGPLHGIRVFDLTLVMVGPWASMQLAAMGADVIHIERPNLKPSDLPPIPPFLKGLTVGYPTWNMNKRGLAVDLKTEEGRRVAFEVASQCDVLLVNMRSGVAERLGLDYERLAAANPGLIYCSVTGWGAEGPLAPKPGSDVVVQGFSGFAAVNGPEGGPGEFYRHHTQVDATTGNYAAGAILLALAARRRRGRGMRIDMNMLRAASQLQTVGMTSYLAAGRLPGPAGSASLATAPHEAYQCQDRKYVGVAVTSEAEWAAFCAALTEQELAPGLADDPRFATNALRVAHRDELHALIAPAIEEMPLAYWLLQFRRNHVAAGYCRDLDDLRRDAQVLANDYLVTLDTHWGRLTTGGPPWRFSATPARWDRGAPLPGEHTAEILAELGVEPASTPGNTQENARENTQQDARATGARS
jgi:crotonobetainyl-CoA:carnitine CoA-transferase CaiB-like acyl-CoA transferase